MSWNQDIVIVTEKPENTYNFNYIEDSVCMFSCQYNEALYSFMRECYVKKGGDQNVEIDTLLLSLDDTKHLLSEIERNTNYGYCNHCGRDEWSIHRNIQRIIQEQQAGKYAIYLLSY